MNTEHGRYTRDQRRKAAYLDCRLTLLLFIPGSCSLQLSGLNSLLSVNSRPPLHLFRSFLATAALRLELNYTQASLNSCLPLRQHTVLGDVCKLWDFPTWRFATVRACWQVQSLPMPFSSDFKNFASARQVKDTLLSKNDLLSESNKKSQRWRNAQIKGMSMLVNLVVN